MILNLSRCNEIDTHSFSSLPVKQNVYKAYKLGDNTVYILKNPSTVSDDNLISIIYSFLLYNRAGKLLFVLSLERLNLRQMSQMLSVSYRDLQEEYNTRGMFSTPRIVLYSADSKEDYGAYTESLNEDYLFPFLWDILLDAVDAADDPVLIK